MNLLDIFRKKIYVKRAVERPGGAGGRDVLVNEQGFCVDRRGNLVSESVYAEPEDNYPRLEQKLY